MVLEFADIVAAVNVEVVTVDVEAVVTVDAEAVVTAEVEEVVNKEFLCPDWVFENFAEVAIDFLILAQNNSHLIQLP